MDKSLPKRLFYRVAGAEGVLSRNMARKGSSDWVRESITYHKSWQEELEESLEDFGLVGEAQAF